MDETDAAIRASLDLDELREAMAVALADFSAGRSEQPVRTVVPAANGNGFLYVMPARTPTALGAKLVTLYPANVGVPTHHAIVLLFDPTTGVPIATLAGNAITELRTAAVSALAAERLARPGASVLAILGSGVQAASHLDALRRVRALRDVRVWSPRRASAFAATRPDVRAVSSAEAAVDGADIVVTATTSRTPVLDGAWLSPGAFVAAVGAPRPDWRELDDRLLGSARLVVDSRAAAAAESGDVRRALELGQRIGAELGEVIAGTLGGRTSPDDVIVFKSLGMAVEDVAAAALVLGRSAQG
ncbi:MAG TPA: ornithine cyclodeaminase family protein [Candidatus Limnocylindrales bacterium]|nr:ornithine cyclodeaminase family protein [Candidatus Limnocylindrales bacterium]